VGTPKAFEQNRSESGVNPPTPEGENAGTPVLTDSYVCDSITYIGNNIT